MIFDRNYIASALHRFLDGDTALECDRLHTRSGKRGGLLRLSLEDGFTVVAKVWRIRNLKERFKSVAGLSNGYREWCMHRLVYQSGISTPEPIAFFRMPRRNGISVEIMVMEDIGAATSSLAILKQLISKGHESKVLSLENDLIDITVRFLNLNIMDIDHQPNNFIVDTNNRLLRVDFECARRRLFIKFRKQEFVTMLARFITGHIHAVQPDVDRSVRFVSRLYERLDISTHLKLLINDKVSQNLAYQLAHNGIDTNITLPVSSSAYK